MRIAPVSGERSEWVPAARRSISATAPATAVSSTGPRSPSGLGGTPSRYLRLGGEVLGWIDDQGSRTESLTSLLFIGQFYPAPSAGFYLKGGVGLGRNEVDFDDGFGVGDTGFAGLLGAGWEVRVGRRLYLNPAIDLVQHRYTGRGGDRYRERIVNFGLGVLFQSGR